MNNNDNANVFSANEINEATNFMRPEGNAAQNGATNDTTEVINPAAPVSSKAMAKTNWGKRLGIVGAGVAAGAGAVFAAQRRDGPVLRHREDRVFLGQRGLLGRGAKPFPGPSGAEPAVPGAAKHHLHGL